MFHSCLSVQYRIRGIPHFIGRSSIFLLAFTSSKLCKYLWKPSLEFPYDYIVFLDYSLHVVISLSLSLRGFEFPFFVFDNLVRWQFISAAFLYALNLCMVQDDVGMLVCVWAGIFPFASLVFLCDLWFWVNHNFHCLRVMLIILRNLLLKMYLFPTWITM